jgi:hypothetical protein
VTALTRRTAALFAATVACALPIAGGAQADPRTPDNVATAVIQHDDGRAFDFAWNVSRQRGIDVVDHLNKAEARASCLRCSATAIAFQVVLVSGTPTPRVVTPVNIADAQNIGCTECVTTAFARQFVRVIPARARISGDGRATLNAVRDRLAALETQNLSPGDTLQVVEAEEARVKEVLNTELVLSNDPDTEATTLRKRFLQDSELE